MKFFCYSYLETKNYVDFIKFTESTLNTADIITTYRKINALKIILLFLTYNSSTFCLKLKNYNKRHVTIFKIKAISYSIIIFISFKIIHIKIATSFITYFSPSTICSKWEQINNQCMYQESHSERDNLILIFTRLIWKCFLFTYSTTLLMMN